MKRSADILPDPGPVGSHQKAVDELLQAGNKDYAAHSLRFFKTGKGQYGEGDSFLGIRVPDIRKIVKKYKDMDLSEVEKVLSHTYHEVRLFGFLLLALKYKNADEAGKEAVYDLYINQKKWVNNWDIVDTTAPNVVGEHLLDRDKKILYTLAVSESLWDRRIAIISTFTFIKHNRYDDTLNIAENLLKDREDLLHKATGWMLREIGKRNLDIEENFLKQHYKTMPRTMLRYAIERFNEAKRQNYLKGRV